MDTWNGNKYVFFDSPKSLNWFDNFWIVQKFYQREVKPLFLPLSQDHNLNNCDNRNHHESQLILALKAKKSFLTVNSIFLVKVKD